MPLLARRSPADPSIPGRRAEEPTTHHGHAQRALASRATSLAITTHRALPVVMGLLAVMVVALVALRIGEADLRSAEADRRTARKSLVMSSARMATANQDPEETVQLVQLAELFLDPSRPAITRQLIEHVQVRAGSDALALVALVAPDGRTLAAEPGGDSITVSTLGSTWHDALGGRAGLTDAFVYGDAVASATLVPLGGEAPWAVLVIVERAAASLWQVALQEVGSLGDEPGGMVLVDRNGVVVGSWDPSQAGEVIMTPREVAALPDNEAVVHTHHRGAAQMTDIATRLPNGYAVIFQQETERIYGDLREIQQQRTQTLLLVLAGTFIALVAFQLARDRGAHRAESRFRAVLRHSQDLVVVTDRTGCVVFASPAVEVLLGQPVHEWEGAPLEHHSHPDDADRLRTLVSRPRSAAELDVRLRAADGSYRWFDIEASEMADQLPSGAIVVTCHEIGGRKELQDELIFLANHDKLTGLANRSRFNQRLQALCGDGCPAQPFVLVYVDLDHFKPINDRLGHDAGDHVLQVVGERLTAAAGERGFVCRFGGDEFGILVDGAGESEGLVIAERLLEAVRAPISVGAELAHLDASIGLVVVSPGAAVHNPEELTRRADQAMYEAKRAGRGRYRLAPPDAASARAAGSGQPSARAAGSGQPSARAAGSGQPSARAAGSGQPSVPARPLIASRSGETPLPATDTGTRDRDRGPATTAVSPALPDRGRRRRRGQAALVAAGLVVLGLAAVGYRQSTEALHAAEQQRLADRGREAIHAATHYSRQFDPERMVTLSTNAPWTLTGGELDHGIVRVFRQSPLAGPDGAVFLATPDGRVLASAPEGARMNIPVDGPVWKQAAAGKASGLPNVADADTTRNYVLLPVLRDGRTAAVVAVGASHLHGTIQRLFEITGSVGSDHGGWSLVDSRGKVISSWSPRMLGTHLASRELLAPVRPGEHGTATTSAGDVLVFAPLRAAPYQIDRFYLAFSMPADEFYQDLRGGRVLRDASLLLVVLGAVAGLALVNHRRELDMRCREERLDALLQHAHDVIVLLDRDGRTRFVSSAVERLLGYRAATLIGTDPYPKVHPDDHERVVGAARSIGRRGATTITDIRVETARGDHRWFDIHAIDLRDHRQIKSILLVCHDVSRRKVLHDELAHQARHDSLTGLLNRAALTDHLKDLTARRPDERFAVLFIDLDLFKPVNDAFGHDAGDEVLRVLARRIEDAVRTGDGGREHDLVCRWGGDEFAVLLHDVDESRARRIADRVIDATRRPITVTEAIVELGATIGIAFSHAERADPDIALREADLAMYQAKEAGRGQYAIFGSAS